MSLSDKKVHFCWIPSHVGIPGNERADAAAKAALQLAISELRIPHTDYKSFVKLYFSNVWQKHWDDVAFNKLQPIKPLLGETKLKDITKRRDEIVLHRERIGHTYLTHGYLLRGEEQPQCETCKCSLSVEHILLNCVVFADSRRKYFVVGSLKELFQTISSCKILGFLREIELYQKF